MTNPYQPSQYGLEPNDNLARRVVVLVAVFIVVQSVGILSVRYLLFDTSPGLTEMIRLGLTTVLAYFLFAGSNVARYLTIFFYSLSVLLTGYALVNSFQNHSLLFLVVVGLLLIANAAIPVLLKATPGIDEEFS